MNIQRREFIRAGGMLAIVGAGGRAVAAEGAAEEKGPVPAAEGAAPAKLIISPPVLQNAADTSIFPFGTQLNVPGYGEGVVEDTGARVKGYRIDVWFPTHAEAEAWGTKEMFVALPQ